MGKGVSMFFSLIFQSNFFKISSQNVHMNFIGNKGKYQTFFSFFALKKQQNYAEHCVNVLESALEELFFFTVLNLVLVAHLNSKSDKV